MQYLRKHKLFFLLFILLFASKIVFADQLLPKKKPLVDQETKIKTERKNTIKDFCKDKCVKNFILRFNSKKG